MPHYSKEPAYITLSAGASVGGGGSMRFISGEGSPGESIGAPGDVYLDTTNGDLYLNSNGKWDVELNLVGPRGENGSVGAQGPPGTGGKDGEDGAQGPPGKDGENGSNGADGKDGFPSEEDWSALVARVEALE